MAVIKRILRGIAAFFREDVVDEFSHEYAIERIPFKTVADRLKEAMRVNRDELGRRTLIPREFSLFFSPADRELRFEVEDILKEELRCELARAAAKWDENSTEEYFSVSINTGEELEQGEFYIQCRMGIKRKKKSKESPETESEGKKESEKEIGRNNDSVHDEALVKNDINAEIRRVTHENTMMMKTMLEPDERLQELWGRKTIDTVST